MQPVFISSITVGKSPYDLSIYFSLKDHLDKALCGRVATLCSDLSNSFQVNKVNNVVTVITEQILKCESLAG